MSLSETIMAISISLIVTAGASFAFSTYTKNTDKMIKNGALTNEVLKTDAKLRDEISKIKLPYYLSSNKEAEKQASLLKEKINSEGKIEIISVELLKDSSGIPQGLDVSWQINGKEHKTSERFSSVSILK